MSTDIPADLERLLRLAYSAEKAAAHAYRGHARSVRDHAERMAIEKIEREEWEHRELVLGIMSAHGVAPSRRIELEYAMIGRIIAASCFVIGWFPAMYFAGRLESGNVNEYVEMKRLFASVGISDHDACLDEMARTEKEHEEFFLEKVTGHAWLPLFARLFRWGPGTSFNDLGPTV